MPFAQAPRSASIEKVNIPDLIDDAKRAFKIGGRGCLVRMAEDEPRYATVDEIAARLEPHPEPSGHPRPSEWRSTLRKPVQLGETS